MRLIKALGLAAIAALAAMAFVGAGTASADTGCTVEVADSGECPAANRVAAGTVIKATSPLAELEAEGLPAVKCTSATEGTVGVSDGPHVSLLGLITGLTFTACSGGCTAVQAPAGKPAGSGEGLPYLVEALALQLLWHVKKDPGVAGAGNPSALLSGCLPPINVNCLYETTSALLTFVPPTATSAAKLVVNKVPLTRGGDSVFCPVNKPLTATYTLTAPNGGRLWLAASP